MNEIIINQRDNKVKNTCKDNKKYGFVLCVSFSYGFVTANYPWRIDGMRGQERVSLGMSHRCFWRTSAVTATVSCGTRRPCVWLWRHPFARGNWPLRRRKNLPRWEVEGHSDSSLARVSSYWIFVGSVWLKSHVRVPLHSWIEASFSSSKKPKMMKMKSCWKRKKRWQGQRQGWMMMMMMMRMPLRVGLRLHALRLRWVRSSFVPSQVQAVEGCDQLAYHESHPTSPSCTAPRFDSVW